MIEAFFIPTGNQRLYYQKSNEWKKFINYLIKISTLNLIAAKEKNYHYFEKSKWIPFYHMKFDFEFTTRAQVESVPWNRYKWRMWQFFGHSYPLTSDNFMSNSPFCWINKDFSKFSSLIWFRLGLKVNSARENIRSITPLDESCIISPKQVF